MSKCLLRAGTVRALAFLLMLSAGALRSRADSTFVYAVQISAVVQTNPPQLTLHWEPDPYGAISYTIYRKAQADTTWGNPIASVSGSLTNYTDYNVALGGAYEYQIVKDAALGFYTGYGYIFAGIAAPLIENRGKLLLLVATNSTLGLSTELARLQADLTGDGWQVIRHDLSSNDTPVSVKTVITNAYYADPTNLNALFLFGHVPILQSGNIDYDTHGARPMPADTYYGDMNDDWPTNPAASPNYLPSDVKLMIGRVDLFNMPGLGATVPWPSETELLRNYLNKDHNWRHKLLTVQRRALMGNRRGDVDGPEAMAACGYRNFEPFVGPGNIPEANIQDAAPDAQRWISLLASGSYLWAFGDGGGQDVAISYLGLDAANYYDVYSTDIVGMDAQVPFVMLFGSHMGNWDHADNILRSVLATPTYGLACCMVGEPHWFFHHMGLGEPLGYGARLSMNNSNLYQNQSNAFARAVYMGLMGDPTLRLDPVAPPAGLGAAVGATEITLNWTASPDAVAGYHVYRAASPGGPFIRLTGSLLGGTRFSDTSAPIQNPTYMVRAVALQSTPSGTYFNPSQGIFITLPATNNPVAILLSASPNAPGLKLTWNTQSGLTYHVQTKTSLSTSLWTNLSAALPAAGNSLSWTDTVSAPGPQRYYRIATP